MLKELIELLVEDKNQEFQERFQSFIDQIPKSKDASSAPAKREFFPGLFLGMFANLKDTELYSKLGINEISFRLDSMNNLHVIVNYKELSKQQIFVFTNNEKTNLEKASKSYRDKYAGGVYIVSVHKGEVTLKRSPSHNNYQAGNEFIKITQIKQRSSRKSLENSMSDILSINKRLEDRRKLDLVDSVFKYHTDLYQKIRELLPENKRNFFNAEALQHGFLTGGLMNFRYRDNLKTNIELVLGQGYADMMLLVRGKDRSRSAIPIIIELKKSSDSNALVKAREEAEWYAKGLHSNKMRIITDSQNVICVGLDLNGGGVSSSVRTIDTPKEPFLQTLLGLLDDKNKGKEIKNLLTEVHYSFPRTQSLYNYLNKFLLGQSLIVRALNENKIESKGIFKYKDNDHLTSFTFQVGDKLFVLNLDSKGLDRAITKQSGYQEKTALPIDEIKKQGTEIKSVVELYVNTAQPVKQSGKVNWYEHFEKSGAVRLDSPLPVEVYSRINKAEGYFYQINSNVNNLKAKFNGAVDHQHNILGDSIGENLSGVQENASGIGKYRELFNSISEELYNHRGYFSDALKAELSYKAFLDGVLTGLSDIKNDLRVIVLTEFQVGRGKRVDVAIQTIGKNGKQGTPILIELKTNPSTKEFSLAQEQLAKYLESPNIKTITDGKQAAGFIAALNTKGTSVETMIRISDKLAVATIQHSSIIAPSSSHRAQKICFKSDASRGKREISGSNCILSSLTEEDIEKISKGKGVVLNGEDIEIDRENFEIDSEKLIERTRLLRDSDDTLRYKDLMKLSDSEKVTGPFSKQVKTLSNTQKLSNHLANTGHIGNYAILSKDLLAHIANGNYGEVAITTGMLGGQYGSIKISQYITSKGVNLIQSGNKIAGMSFKVAAPVVPNLITAPLNVIAFKEGLEGCQKEVAEDFDAGLAKHDSCVRMVENGIYIAEAVTTTGIGVGAATGAIASGGAVATLAFPVGTAVVVVTVVGSQVYIAVHKANEIDKIIPLTRGEWWNEFGRSLIFKDTSPYLVELMKNKEFNNKAVEEAIQLLQNNPNLRVMVIPSMGVKAETIKKYIKCSRWEVIGDLSTGCGWRIQDSNRDWFYNNMRLDDVYKVEETTNYTPVITEDNEVSFNEKIKVTWSRSSPDEPTQSKLLCAPEGKDGKVLDNSYRCNNAIGIEYSPNRTGDDALFRLLDGNDRAVGFPDYRNIFLVDNGYKKMIGGNKDDQFILRGNKTIGELFGREGDDSIFMDNFISGNNPLFAVFKEEKLKLLYGDELTCIKDNGSEVCLNLSNPNLNINIHNINQFYGRSRKPDYASIACTSDIKYIDLLGSDSNNTIKFSVNSPWFNGIAEFNDQLYIAENKEDNCSYSLTSVIHSFTVVENKAVKGNFVYMVQPEKGVATLSLNNSPSHNFIFKKVGLFDIKTINVNKENDLYRITLVFNVEKEEFELKIHSQEIANLKFELSDGAIIDLVEKRVYMRKTLRISDIGEYNSIKEKLSSAERRLEMPISVELDLLKIYSSDMGNHLLYKVYSEDLLNMKELRMSDRNMGDYTFARQGDNLLITNIFSNDKDQRYTIAFIDFYLSEDLSKDMSIVFHDEKRISLMDYTNKIYDAKDVDQLQEEYDNEKYIGVALHSAINKKDLGEIISLLRQGANFDFKDDNDKTALDVARETILDSSGKIQSDLAGRKLIHLASESGNVKAIEYLLNKEEDVNVIDNSEWTPLHYATKEGNLEAVKYLVDEKKAGFYSTKYETNDGQSAVHIASFYGKKDVVNFLITKEGVGADWKDGYYRFVFFGHQGDSFTPLHWAVKGGHLDLVNHLINLGSNIYAKDYNGRIPIDIAKEEDQMDIVKRLEEVMRGYENGKRAIHFAAENNDIDALKYRINQGDDINLADNNWWRPLHYASASGSSDSTKLLLDNGAGFYSYTYKTSTCKAPIHIAAENGYIDIVKTFLDRGVDIDWRDSYDRCGGEWLAPLHYAAKGGYPDTVRSLINRGANIERLTFYWKTPIFYAAEKGHVDVVSELVRRGANVDAREKSNFLRPIHYAIKNGYLNVVKSLVESKADITLGEAYDSPLHWAIIHNQFNIIEYLSKQLKQRGIEPSSIKDYYGKTALDLAREKGHTNIVSHLESLNRNRRSIESSQRDKHSVKENKKSSTEELSYLKLDNEKSVMRKAIDNKSTIHNNTLETENFNFNGLLLLSTLLSKIPVIGKFFPKVKLPDTNSTTFTSMSLPESMTYAAEITQEFEKILNKTATHLSISKESLNLNLVLNSEIAKLFRDASKPSELSKVLYSHAREIGIDNSEFLNLIKAELPNLEKTYESKFNSPHMNITSLPINNTVPSSITTPSEKEIKYLPSSSMSNIDTLAVANNSMTR